MVLGLDRLGWISVGILNNEMYLDLWYHAIFLPNTLIHSCIIVYVQLRFKRLESLLNLH